MDDPIYSEYVLLNRDSLKECFIADHQIQFEAHCRISYENALQRTDSVPTIPNDQVPI